MVVRSCGFQLLNDKSHLTRDSQIKESMRVYQAALRAPKRGKSLEICSAPPGLLCIQNF